tara:strand:- start:10 stop:1797 length:1788 start_codon:yes stop_codon:yes gene_type:complete
MARFGQEFIRSLTNPSYSEGLFQLGGAIGSTPSRVMEEKKEREAIGMMRGMSPLERADYQIKTAETAADLVAAQDARTRVLAAEGTKSMDAILTQMNSETDPQRIKELQEALNATARQTGNNTSTTAGAGKTLISAIETKKTKDRVLGIQSQIQQLKNSFEENAENPEQQKKILNAIVQLEEQAGMMNASVGVSRGSGGGSSGGGTLGQGTTAQGNAIIAAKGKDQTQADINRMISQLNTLNNPEQMLEIESEIVRMANSVGIESKSYVGMTQKALDQRATDKMDRLKVQNETQVLQEDQLASQIANQILPSIMNGGSFPTQIPDQNGQMVDINPELQLKIQERVSSLIGRKNDVDMAVTSGQLPESFVNWIANNQDLIDTNLAVGNAVKTLQETDGRVQSKLRTNAVKTIANFIAKEDEAALARSRSDAVIDMQINGLIEDNKNRSDLVFFGNTMQDFLEDDSEENAQNIKTFREQARTFVQSNPNATAREIVSAGMIGMRNLIGDEATQQRREDMLVKREQPRKDLMKLYISQQTEIPQLQEKLKNQNLSDNERAKINQEIRYLTGQAEEAVSTEINKRNMLRDKGPRATGFK